MVGGEAAVVRPMAEARGSGPTVAEGSPSARSNRRTPRWKVGATADGCLPPLDPLEGKQWMGDEPARWEGTQRRAARHVHLF